MKNGYKVYNFKGNLCKPANKTNMYVLVNFIFIMASFVILKN